MYTFRFPLMRLYGALEPSSLTIPQKNELLEPLLLAGDQWRDRLRQDKSAFDM